jgi:hypothetical protein
VVIFFKLALCGYTLRVTSQASYYIQLYNWKNIFVNIKSSTWNLHIYISPAIHISKVNWEETRRVGVKDCSLKVLRKVRGFVHKTTAFTDSQYITVMKTRKHNPYYTLLRITRSVCTWVCSWNLLYCTLRNLPIHASYPGPTLLLCLCVGPLELTRSFSSSRRIFIFIVPRVLFRACFMPWQTKAPRHRNYRYRIRTPISFLSKKMSPQNGGFLRPFWLVTDHSLWERISRGCRECELGFFNRICKKNYIET